MSSRRQFLSRCALLAATGGLPTWSQSAPVALGASPNPAPPAKPPIPFETVGPFTADTESSYAFFAFTCPFCREHMPNIQAWGSTLPPPLRFASSPIPSGPGGLQGSRAFYAVRRAAPTKLREFERVVYAALHDARAPEEDEKTYLSAARAAGIDSATLRPWWVHNDVQRDVFYAKVRYERYAIDRTPSLAVGGRYVLYADLVNGDYAMLINLANGVISQMLPQSSGNR